jgi:hypothetical protein
MGEGCCETQFRFQPISPGGLIPLLLYCSISTSTTDKQFPLTDEAGVVTGERENSYQVT